MERWLVTLGLLVLLALGLEGAALLREARRRRGLRAAAVGTGRPLPLRADRRRRHRRRTDGLG